MHINRSNTETASKFAVQRKKCNMLNDKRIKTCISIYDNGTYSRMQFLAPVNHSMGAHTEALCLTADSSSSSSNDEDETMRGHRRRQSRQNRQRQLQQCICLHLNQWSISVQSSTVWQPIKMPPFARPIPSVCPCVCP